MRKSSFWSALPSVFAGVTLAVVVMFLASMFTRHVRADDDNVDGYWCNAAPPDGCEVFGCFVRGDGVKKCKFIAYRNGADCSTSQTCVSTPPGGGF